MNEFIKKFSQYFIYKGRVQMVLLHQNMEDGEFPKLLKFGAEFYILNSRNPSSPADGFMLTADDPVEANEIYERIINFYNENIKEK